MSRFTWRRLTAAIAICAIAASAAGHPRAGGERRRLGYIKECYADKAGWHIVANEARIVGMGRRTRVIHNLGRLVFHKSDFGPAPPPVILVSRKGGRVVATRNAMGELAARFTVVPHGRKPFSATPFLFVERNGKLVEIRQHPL
jgi:hypothetical protein